MFTRTRSPRTRSTRTPARSFIPSVAGPAGALAMSVTYQGRSRRS